MRKWLFITLICLLCAALCACSAAPVTPTDAASSEVTYINGETTSRGVGDDIRAALTKGEMALADQTVTAAGPATVTLGMASADMLAALGEANCLREVGVRYIRYTCGNAFLYYTNDDRDNGLAAVVYHGTAYGLEPGESRLKDVTTVMGDAQTKPAGDDAAAMFLYFDTDATYVDYPCGNNHISFFFDKENRLTTLVIYQDGLWIY